MPSLSPSRPVDRGVRVLVVEDNVDAAETLADLLRLWGYEVEVVYDGQAAIEAAPGFRPDAILLDIGLPRMNGYDVARWLRRRSDLGGVLLIAVTGYGQESDRARGHEAGFDHHLVKPVDIEFLRRLLSEIEP